MSKITIMQGLPASGKSTKAKEIIEKTGNTVRINGDLMRKMLHCNKWSGKNEGITIQSMRILAKYHLLNNTNVIIDSTNLNPNTKQAWVDLAKECKSKIEHIVLDTPIEECFERDSIRKNKVGKNVIVRMALQYQDYLKDEKVIICDLDGTLCDITHRLKFVKGQVKDWKSFFAGISSDSLRMDTAEKLNKYLNKGHKCIFITARPSDNRKETTKWLHKNYFHKNCVTLIMREKRDRRPDTEVKSDIYEKYLKHLNIVKVFDDRPSVIRMWREKGLEVEDVGEGIEF